MFLRLLREIPLGGHVTSVTSLVESALRAWCQRSLFISLWFPALCFATCSFSTMPAECAAVGCTEYATKQCPYSFHRFPSNPEIRKCWIVKMNRYNPETKKLWEPNKHDRLCSKHFEPGCFTDRTRLSSTMPGMTQPYRPQLKADAVPTIFCHKRKEEVPKPRGASIKRRKQEVSTAQATV